MSQLHFASSAQTGLSTAASGSALRLELDAAVTIGAETYERTLELAGPGDVASIDPSVWGTRYPADGAIDAEITFMPSITMTPADLPWRVSRSTTPVIPWIGLVVVPEIPGISVTTTAGSSNASLMFAPDSMPSGLLPEIAHAHRLAHLQAAEPVHDTSLERSTARLLSAVTLEPETHYIAAVVPLTAEGVAAGLGRDTSDFSSTAPAWDLTDSALDDAGITLPAFTLWRFATGPAGDFASLTRRIVGGELDPTTGLASLEVSSSGTMLPPWNDRPVVVDYEGALQSPDATPRSWAQRHRKPTQEALTDILNGSIDRPTVPERAPAQYNPEKDDPVVAPPVYGELNASLTGIPGGSHWARTLNLQPQWRAAAGAGARAIRARQSEHVSTAWSQLSAAMEAAAAANRARLAAAVSMRIGTKLAQASDEVIIATTPGQARTKRAARGDAVTGFDDPVVARALRRSTATGRAFARALDAAVIAEPESADVWQPNSAARSVRAATRAEKRYPKTVHYADFAGHPGTNSEPSLNAGANEDLLDDDFHIEAANLGLAQAVQQRLEHSPIGQLFIQRVGPVRLGPLLEAELTRPGALRPGSLTPRRSTRIGSSSLRADAAPLSREARAVATREAAMPVTLDPSAAVLTSLLSRNSSEHLVSDAPAPEPVSVQLRYDNPFINDLLAIDQRLVIPGLHNFPDDTMAIASTNSSHVAAVLGGANDELIRELLWHGVPIDPAQTPMRRYWPTDRDDVDAMADWRGPLNKIATSTNSLTVLVVRAQLFARYPDARIVAVPGAVVGTRLEPTGTAVLPDFEGWLDHSTRYVAFDVDTALMRGNLSGSNPAAAPGWFIGFEEASTGPRFRTGSADSGTATRVAVEQYAPPFRGLIHASELG